MCSVDMKWLFTKAMDGTNGMGMCLALIFGPKDGFSLVPVPCCYRNPSAQPCFSIQTMHERANRPSVYSCLTPQRLKLHRTYLS